ncbi:MAG: transcriptional regulator BetI [Pseudomonadota bacterium]
MPKLGMQPVRRKQIIEATMQCITSLGIHKSSMQKIADRAEINSSLIVHYFKDRPQLLEAVYTHIYQLMDAEIRWRVKAAGSPMAKAIAICDAQVCDDILRREVVVTWVALFALIPELPSLARLDYIYAKRLRSNLVHHLQTGGVERSNALQVADEISLLIDGLWLRKAADANLDGDQLRKTVSDYLIQNLPSSA